MSIVIERDVYPQTAKLVALYDAVGWKAYTRDEASLTRAVANSLAVVTAWEDEEHLVGLARAVGDGEHILYVQDLLVLPRVQGQGVGRALLEQLLAMYPQVRQKFLMAETDPALEAFYQHSGWMKADGQGLQAWVCQGVQQAGT
jgi:GNAT superfamily N-acetyltransferase